MNHSSTSTTKTYPWKSRAFAYDEALDYIKGRQAGTIKSLKCKSQKLNDAFADGFEFGTAVCFAARPGVGKSLLKEQLIREFFELNSDIKFRVLSYDLEMIPRVTALREFSSVLDRTYKYLLSAEEHAGSKFGKQDLDVLKAHVSKITSANNGQGYPIDLVDTPPTVEEFEQQVNQYMEAHALKDEQGNFVRDEKGNIVWPNVVVGYDHARLTKKMGRPETEMLQELGAAIIRLKLKYSQNILIIVFNHINRKVLEPNRCENGKSSNYLTDDDLLGSDSFCQNFEVIVAIDCPQKRHIDFYGPEKYITTDPRLLLFIFLKTRNGDVRISFFRGEYERMELVEAELPPTAKKIGN